MKERPQSIKWVIPPRFDETGQQISSGIAVDGREYPDGVPLAPPIGYEAPTQLEDLIAQVVRRRDFERAMEAAGAETFDEADDFDVDEDYDPRFEETIYEAYFEAKSKRAADKAAQVEASRRASADSSFEASRETPLEKPISGRTGVEPAIGNPGIARSPADSSPVETSSKGSDSADSGRK